MKNLCKNLALVSLIFLLSGIVNAADSLILNNAKDHQESVRLDQRFKLLPPVNVDPNETIELAKPEFEFYENITKLNSYLKIPNIIVPYYDIYTKKVIINFLGNPNDLIPTIKTIVNDKRCKDKVLELIGRICGHTFKTDFFKFKSNEQEVIDAFVGLVFSNSRQILLDCKTNEQETIAAETTQKTLDELRVDSDIYKKVLNLKRLCSDSFSLDHCLRLEKLKKKRDTMLDTLMSLTNIRHEAAAKNIFANPFDEEQLAKTCKEEQVNCNIKAIRELLIFYKGNIKEICKRLKELSVTRDEEKRKSEVNNFVKQIIYPLPSDININEDMFAIHYR